MKGNLDFLNYDDHVENHVYQIEPSLSFAVYHMFPLRPTRKTKTTFFPDTFLMLFKYNSFN